MYGVRTWFDAQKMKGNIRAEMTKAIDNADWVFVFVTQRYIDKIASEDMKVRNDLVPFNLKCSFLM